MYMTCKIYVTRGQVMVPSTTCKEICYKVTSDGINFCDELFSAQEEADEWIIQHANPWFRHIDLVIIISQDMDILVQTIAFSADTDITI